MDPRVRRCGWETSGWVRQKLHGLNKLQQAEEGVNDSRREFGLADHEFENPGHVRKVEDA
jgi:hypothetical protein